MNMNKIYLTVLLLIALSTAYTQTIETGFIVHDGFDREYSLTIPSEYSGNEALPLVLNLHGLGTDGPIQRGYSQFDPVAEANTFFVVYPDGIDEQWDSGFGTGVDDVGFLTNLIDSLAANYNIDMNRVYSTGMSNGGFQSYQLACEISEKIAAIASVTGAYLVTLDLGCNPVHPMPVMEIHGTNDVTVPYTGNFPTYYGALEGVEQWVMRNNCDPTPIITDVPDTNTTDGCTASRYYYGGCDNGADVELYRIDGGGHSWPGSPIPWDVTNYDMNASEVIWEFFNRFTLNGLTTSISSFDNMLELQFAPNPFDSELRVNWETEKMEEISVINLTGQLVYYKTIESQEKELTINSNDWSSGIYMIQVKAEGQTYAYKIIKQ